MPEVAIVTDSTSDLTKEFIGDLSINIIPLKIKLNINYYRDEWIFLKESSGKDFLQKIQLKNFSAFTS